MSLTVYQLGDNIVAALNPDDAVAVMEQHEPAGTWRAEQALELQPDELSNPVDATSAITVADELARSGASRLIRWAYPA